MHGDLTVASVAYAPEVNEHQVGCRRIRWQPPWPVHLKGTTCSTLWAHAARLGMLRLVCAEPEYPTLTTLQPEHQAGCAAF